MNAVIWLRLRLDAQVPIPANPAARSPAPTYCATTVDQGIAAPRESPSGMSSVSAERDPEEQHRREVLAQQQLELAQRLRQDDFELAAPDVLRERAHRHGRDEEEELPRQQSSIGRRLATCER